MKFRRCRSGGRPKLSPSEFSPALRIIFITLYISMARPALSLIVATYNQAHYLPLVCKSIIQQDVEVPFELLFCDDGSSDNTFSVISDWARAHPSTDLRYIWQPDCGFRLARSRNNGLRAAQGELVVFVDADTWLAPSFLRDHLNAHRRAKRKILAAGIVLTREVLEIGPDCEALAIESLKGDDPQIPAQSKWLETEQRWMACLGGNLSVRRDWDIFFDEGVEGWGSEDRDFSYRLVKAGCEVELILPPNAVQFRLRNAYLDWHPRYGSHNAIVRFLNAKTYLADRYPDGTMDHSLLLVRHCWLDPVNNRWSGRAEIRSESPKAILQEYQDWKTKNSEKASLGEMNEVPSSIRKD
jgi:glycosyltransferase involved in cell wall biosynthesis